MNDLYIPASDSWQNWVTALGYLGFTLFIIWQIVKPREK